jgi:hypothetical protein
MSQYIPLQDIPSEIHAAAETLHTFFEKQGMQNWEFSHVADRRLVDSLKHERDQALAWNEEGKINGARCAAERDALQDAVVNLRNVKGRYNTQRAAQELFALIPRNYEPHH